MAEHALGTIYSQPSETGTGRHWGTKLITLVSYLKIHGPIRLDNLAITLSLETLLDPSSILFKSFIAHERVEHDVKTDLYKYKVDYAMKNASDLHAVVAGHMPRGGIGVKLLKESWAGVVPAIEELEREGKVLVTRTGNTTEKEGTIKTVFLDQIGFLPPIDQEFKDLWNGMTTPASADDLAEELKTAGLATASTVPVPVIAVKKKKGKGSGSHNRKLKITNTHLKSTGIDLSVDFVPGNK